MKMTFSSRNKIFYFLLLFFLASSCQNQTTKNRELEKLKIELDVREQLLIKAENGIQNIKNRAPSCATVTIDESPLIELRDEITTLKNKIAELEE